MSTELNDFLKSEFNRRRLKNSRYSLRKFALDLNVSAPVMSRILNDKIIVSKRALKSISLKLAIPAKLADDSNASGTKNILRENKISYLNLEQIKLIKSWYFPAICEAITLPEFKHDTKWLAQKLNITLAMVNECIDLLTECNLITLDSNNKWILKHHEISSLAIQPTKNELMQLQQDFFNRSSLTIESYPIEERDHSTIVISIDDELLTEAKLRIKKFRRQLATYLEKKSKTKKNSVYQLSIGLSPLIKI